MDPSKSNHHMYSMLKLSTSAEIPILEVCQPCADRDPFWESADEPLCRRDGCLSVNTLHTHT